MHNISFFLLMHDRNIELKPSVVYFIHTGHFANEYIGLKEKKMSLRQSISSSNKPTIFRPTKEVQFYVYAEKYGS